MKIKKVSIMMKNKAGKFEFSHYVWKVFSDDGEWLEQCDTEDEANDYVNQKCSGEL